MIAPEATIDAKEGGAMMPLLALGLPSGVATAILLTAFQIHGIFPGQRLFQTDMPLVWVMILAMVFSNVTTSVLGMLWANWLVKITFVPAYVVVPVVMVLGAVGAYADQQSMFGVTLMVVFGLMGLIMARLGYGLPPLLIGMILVPLTEQQFQVSLQLSHGTLDFLLRPITLTILLAVSAIMLLPVFRSLWRRRVSRAQAAAGIETELELVEDDQPEVQEVLPPWLHLSSRLPAGRGALLSLADDADAGPARMFPQIVLVVLTALLCYQVYKELRRYLQARSEAATEAPEGERVKLPDWLVATWLLGLPVLMVVLGVVISSGVYTAAFIVGWDWRGINPKRAVGGLVGGLVLALLIQWVFVDQLGLRFYQGIFSS